MKSKTVWTGVRFGSIGATSFLLSRFNEGLAKRYFLREISEMPALGQKFAQILAFQMPSFREEISSPKAAPLSWVKGKLEAEVPDFSKKIIEIQSDPEVASLGQVHRARLNTGEDVAVKVRYPGVDQELKNQLDLLVLAFKNAPKKIRNSFDLKSYENFLSHFFLEELDYQKEAIAQKCFRDTWSGHSKIVIPIPFPNWSSSSIFVQEFQESLHLSKLKGLKLEPRLECAKLLTQFFLDSLFRTGLVHTDLHPKNWGFRPDQRELVVYDFGATLRLSSDMVSAFFSLLSGKCHTRVALLEAYERIGFDKDALDRLGDVLPKLTDLFFTPFRNAGSFSFKEWKIQEEAESILGARKWEFRQAGPPWFLMVIRSFNGWLHAIRELDVSLNLDEFHYKPDLSHRVQSHPLEGICAHFDLKIRHLRVSIKINGVETVSLEFPSHSVESLEDMIPDSVLSELQRSGVNLSEIRRSALDSGLVPQLLFEKCILDRTYRVWIE